LKPKNLEGVTVVLQLTQVKEDALSQVSQVSNTYPTMNVETVVVLFAIAAIFGLVGVVVVDIILTAQEAEAKGCSPGGTGFNASLGRCFRP
jgi:hypothetical protein